jgi:hypothetical protein
MQTVDVAPVRTLAFTERLHTELRGEAFNALNHSNWGTPNRFVPVRHHHRGHHSGARISVERPADVLSG